MIIFKLSMVLFVVFENILSLQFFPAYFQFLFKRLEAHCCLNVLHILRMCHETLAFVT